MIKFKMRNKKRNMKINIIDKIMMIKSCLTIKMIISNLIKIKGMIIKIYRSRLQNYKNKSSKIKI